MIDNRKEKKIVYLTGGIATGKSTVAKFFKELGADVIDADEIAHKVIEKGTQAYSKIVKEFGKDILTPSGAIDRRKLGALVFKDKEKLRKLESIVHPEVLKKMADEIARSKSDIVIVEIPLIFEKKMDLHPVVVVYAPREVQKSRLMRRDGLTEEEAEVRLSSQIDIDEKRKLADFVIDNSSDLTKTKEETKRLFHILRGD